MQSRQGCSDRSMPKPVTHLFAVLLVLYATAASAQPQPASSPLAADERRCAGLNATPPDQQTEACTTLLGSGRYTGDNLAIVYANRGIAYARSGDYDRAISEF